MDQFSISNLADWLEAHNDDLMAKKTQLDPNKVYAIVDYLKVLKKPAEKYLHMKQADYYTTESDHKLNLPDDNVPLTATHDRIMVNHVDGSIKNDQLNFTYNHEPVFDGGYTPQRDLNIVKYGLEVIGAVATSGHIETVSAALSPDAVLTLVLAATAFSSYQA
ncbi:putative uncharacterized protein [Lacticaseibacillus paracasei NRIC 1981]|uniref:hypothetical protein n=1 Tax=Lacticaseibacillus paracasei TaxID=1597 RepID=UPI0005E616EF|nr:hypothetical protein [Lacticaseibacillus paracasei]GAN41176.1 putative uncharacterized protein [Lacticaseibacillus paracasei NRIC 1981]